MKTQIEVFDGACDELIGSLDALAREYDNFEYGLPIINDEYHERMREAVRHWVRDFVWANELQPKRATSASAIASPSADGGPRQ